MTTLNAILIIVAIIALGAASVLCVYLISVLTRVRSILVIVEDDIRELSAKVIPVVENLEVITDKVRSVTESIDEQVDIVRQSINSVKQIADNIVDFERRVQEQIEEPVVETVGMIAAVLKGVQTFVTRLRA